MFLNRRSLFVPQCLGNLQGIQWKMVIFSSSLFMNCEHIWQSACKLINEVLFKKYRLRRLRHATVSDKYCMLLALDNGQDIQSAWYFALGYPVSWKDINPDIQIGVISGKPTFFARHLTKPDILPKIRLKTGFRDQYPVLLHKILWDPDPRQRYRFPERVGITIAVKVAPDSSIHAST